MCMCVYGSVYVSVYVCVWSVCFRAQFNKLSNILPGEFHKRRNICESVCSYRSVCVSVATVPVCVCVCVDGFY